MQSSDGRLATTKPGRSGLRDAVRWLSPLALIAAANASFGQSAPVTAAPQDTAAAVISRINSSPGIRSVAAKWKSVAPRIAVAAQAGIVTLTGKVATDEGTAAAGGAALQVNGVRAVANHLQTVDTQFFGDELRIPHTRPIVDAAIDAVVLKIVGSPAIHVIPHVYWSTSDQSVQVCGLAASDADRKAATNAAIATTDLPIGSCMSVRPDAFPPDVIRAIEANAAKSTIPTVTPAPKTGLPAAGAGPGTAGAPAAASAGHAPAPIATGGSAGLIPLCAGLTVVTAVASNGDYESIKTVESMDAKQMRLKYSAETGPPWWSDPRPEARKLTSTHRTVLMQDLATASRYDQIFVGTQDAPETAPGTTAISASAAVLRDLKTRGQSRFQYCVAADDVPVMGPDNKLGPGYPGGCGNFIGDGLKRVGDKPVYLRVLVDGVPTDLPAIQARGPEGKEEFFFLDDDRNPLTLAFRLGIGAMPALSPSFRKACEAARTEGTTFSSDGTLSCDLPDGGDRDTLRVVKISTHCNVPAATADSSGRPGALEDSLAKNRSADVYSIYFAFNSDVIREESKPTLQEIAEVLRRHPDWKLRVSGHTDGIGGDAKNLDLSRRRAAAVKNALVAQYSIAAARLSTDGFGKSRPKDTNDTLEGRAHNRRVELTRTD
jgi:outer membrane protein OmpA-like peptidoglycan-associated protein